MRSEIRLSAIEYNIDGTIDVESDDTIVVESKLHRRLVPNEDSHRSSHHVAVHLQHSVVIRRILVALRLHIVVKYAEERFNFPSATRPSP